jgi:hypothetical protein
MGISKYGIGGLMVLLVTLVWAMRTPATARAQPMPGQSRCKIPFTGTASGGTLVLAGTLNRNASAVAVETAPGETAESVARRLAQRLNEEPWWGMSHPGREVARSSAGTLLNLPGDLADYMIAGTEHGLGIPPPPTSLTCNYDSSSGALILRWSNPPGGYDTLRLIWNWDKYNHRGGAAFPGTTDSYTMDLRNAPPEKKIADLDIWLIGLRKGIPSDAAAMHVSNSVQQELFGIPFANDTAPNWTAWSLGGPDATKPEMATRQMWVPKGRLYDSVRSADRKPYQQVIRGAGEAGGTGGVSRRFLGLFPGHIYRITVRLNTMSTSLKDNADWSYSFHAVAGDAAKGNLTARQMAGLDALPDGDKGPTAGQVCQYDAHRTTQGKYEESAGGRLHHCLVTIHIQEERRRRCDG